ncbi:hypothetical protein HT031_006227 [Scenedesmus sp. PABB004]|nr:hypothetical protein HT031_006227 [Scenedesmus sp. PABB004]
MLDAFPPPNSALFGHTGCVGSSLRAAGLEFEHTFNSQNVDDARGRAFDLVVFAALPAAKWLANKEPARDLATVQSLQDVLRSVECERFVLISTIDVYHPTDDRRDEDGAPGGGAAADGDALHAYGRHRALFERFVRDRYGDKAIVVRLPALFGLHLKKNYVFDLLHANNVAAINTNTSFQWYDTSALARNLQRVLALGLREVNLFPEPVATPRLVGLVADAGLLPDGPVGHAGPAAAYDLCTKHARALGSSSAGAYSQSAASVEAAFRAFLARHRLARRTTVSCIAWKEADDSGAAGALQLAGVRLVELAPTRFFSWEELEAAHAQGGQQLEALVAGLVGRLAAARLQISSVQAILYNKPDLVLFGSPEARASLVRHVQLIVDLVGALRPAVRPGAPVPIVFGAPKNRRVPEGMSAAEADDIFAGTFAGLAAYAQERGCVLCLEPNAAEYGCNFVTTSRHAAALVRRVAHPGLRVHLDAACMALAGEDAGAAVADCVDVLGHVHVSEPFLAPLSAPKPDAPARSDHARFAAALDAAGYDKLLSVEMVCSSLPELAASLAVFASSYAV